VKDILTKPLVSIQPGASLLEASKLLVDQNVGLLVIFDSGHLGGVLSERDIIKSVAKGEAMDTTADKLCTKNVVTVKASADVAEAAKAMNKHRIRHVVVVDEQARPIGVVSMRDLVGERATLKAILSSHEKEIFAGGD